MGDAAVTDDPVEGTRLGGGAKSVLRLNADGVGGATCAGPACLAAVEPRIDENIFLPELKSTSPNFWGMRVAMRKSGTNERARECSQSNGDAQYRDRGQVTSGLPCLLQAYLLPTPAWQTPQSCSEPSAAAA